MKVMKNPSPQFNWPDKAELQRLLMIMPLIEVGRKFGMSPGAVREMAKKLGYPILKPSGDSSLEPKIMPAEAWQILLPVLTKDELRLAALRISNLSLTEVKNLGPDSIICDNGLPDSIAIRGTKVNGKKGRIVSLLPNASVMLSMTMPQSGQLFSCDAGDVMRAIYKKARDFGIEADRNFLKGMNNIYWSVLNTGACISKMINPQNKKIVDKAHARQASMGDCVTMLTTLPSDTPDHLRRWVKDWVEHHANKFKKMPNPNARMAL